MSTVGLMSMAYIHKHISYLNFALIAKEQMIIMYLINNKYKIRVNIEAIMSPS